MLGGNMDFYQMLKLDYGKDSESEEKLLEFYINKFGDYLGHFKPIYDLYMFHPVQVLDERIKKKYGEKFIKILIEECLIYRIEDMPNDYFLDKFFDVIINHIDNLRSQLYFEILLSIPLKSNLPLKQNIVIHLLHVFLDSKVNDQVVDKTLSCLIQIDKLMANHISKSDVKFGNLLKYDYQVDFFYNFLRTNNFISEKGNYIYYKERNEGHNLENSKTLLANAISSFYINNYFRPDLSDRSARDLFMKTAKKDFGVDISASTFRDSINYLRNNPEAIDKNIPKNFEYHIDPDTSKTFYL